MNLYLKNLFLGFPEAATPIMEGIIDFHNYVFFFLVLVSTFVFLFMCYILIYFWYLYEIPQQKWDVSLREFTYSNNRVTHGAVLEVIWTMIPALILVTIAFPSFSLLYSIDEIMMPAFTLKVMGHQWYWSYEYTIPEKEISALKLVYTDTEAVSDEVTSLGFDSYMVPEADLALGDHRLLEVTESVVLPIGTYIRVLITSADVLHSFSVGSLGIKADAVPGRLNQAAAYIKREGVFYGQCSELCGVSRMMPIVVRAVGLEEYTKWLFYQGSKE